MKMQRISVLRNHRFKEITLIASLKPHPGNYKLLESIQLYYMERIEKMVEKLTYLMIGEEYARLTESMIAYEASIYLATASRPAKAQMCFTCPLDVDVLLFQGSVMTMWQMTDIAGDQMYVADRRVFEADQYRMFAGGWWQRPVLPRT